MLKIKDNVDLKQLEKFGFEYRENYYIQYIKNFRVSDLRVEHDNIRMYYSVNNAGDHDIEYASLYMIPKYINDLELDRIDLINLIKRLIEAGLVEKVVE